ncbi:MAG: Rid family detoxifying hydrolase [bacterium]
MSIKTAIQTKNAPQAIGTYSQAVSTQASRTIYASGQIPLVPETGEQVEGDMHKQVIQVFENLKAVAKKAGVTLDHAVKVNVFLIDLGHFQIINQVMEKYFSEPFPARAAVQVSALPKGVEVEIDAIFVSE